MRVLLVFVGVLLFGDVSNILLKIKDIENIKKNFLDVKYNIFGAYVQNVKIVPLTQEIKLKIYAIFNNKVNMNGKWYKLGEEINGYKIVKILKNGVVLKKANKYFYLKIKNTILKVQK